MVYTFFTPVSQKKTCAAIKTTILTIGGDFQDRPDGSIVAKWRSPKFYTVFPTKFTFYIGEDLVRAVSGSSNMQTITMRLKLRGALHVWDYFISNLIRLYPDMDFGIQSGDAEIVAAEFMGDATEEVLVSKTYHSPSLSGAIIGGKLFGPAGAVIGSSYGSSQTTTTSYTRFSDSVLTQVRYSNGLLAEGMLSRKSPTFHEITVNMRKLSNTDALPHQHSANTPIRNTEGLSLELKNAVNTAKDYLTCKQLSYSRKELIEQLEYEGYSTSAATKAIDYLAVDWNEQAAKSARGYMDCKNLSFSRKGLVEQLEHDGFTPEQAAYGVESVGY